RQAFELGLATLARPAATEPDPYEQIRERVRGLSREVLAQELTALRTAWDSHEAYRATFRDIRIPAATVPLYVAAIEAELAQWAPRAEAAAEHDLAVLQQAHDQRLEYLTPSLSPIEDVPTLASTPAAIASQPPPADPITDEQYENEIAPALEVPDPEPSEADELDSFLEALS
ncbi:MAG TPA: hypothetical protein VGC79_01485, partial [Polyangiaceae bacterium]